MKRLEQAYIEYSYGIISFEELIGILEAAKRAICPAIG